jgi:hypothetical protein
MHCDTNSSPSLGYHYDPIDYIVDNYAITNATLTVTNGTAIASYNEPGIELQKGSSIVSFGSPLYPNWFVRYSSVQEEAVLLGGTNAAGGLTVGVVGVNGLPTGQYLFSKFACPAGCGDLFNVQSTGNSYSNLLLQDCELWSGGVNFGGNTNTVTTLRNNLFDRTAFSAFAPVPVYLYLTNNLFFGTTIFFYNEAGATNNWQAYNNAFDSCGIDNSQGMYGLPFGQVPNGYNAYLNCTNTFSSGYLAELSPTNASDFVTNATMAYQTGPLGSFYQPTNSHLINIGSTNANLVGMYHFTVTTNEAIEATNTVSIGYHYVATDTNGNPLDTYWLGIPDYLADSGGNGALGAWMMQYFGQLGIDPNGDADGDGTNNLQEYLDGTDPYDVPIVFSLSFANQWVNTNMVPMWANISSGLPFYTAVLVDNTNLSAATWTAYTSNLLVNLGTTDGWHQVAVGMARHTNEIVTWEWTRLKLDRTPPLLAVTNPTSSTVMQPIMELQGYCPEALTSISYDLTNATGLVTNQQVLVSDQFYDTNTYELTTNAFQAFDIPLTNGLNTITLHATDWAGNSTTTNFNFTLDYSGKTNLPTMQFYWPTNGTQIAGTNFTWRGGVSDFTATVTAQTVDTNGDTNIFNGVVERNGNFWVQNLPLNTGTNSFTLTVTDAAGNVATTNMSVVSSALVVTVNESSSDSQLWQSTINLTGTISDATYAVWVNGVKGHNNGDGTWSANNVPVNKGGTASFVVTAYAPTEQQPDGSYGN